MTSCKGRRSISTILAVTMAIVMTIAGCSSASGEAAPDGQADSSPAAGISVSSPSAGTVADEEDGVDYSRALAKAGQDFDEEDAVLSLKEGSEAAKSLPAGRKDYTVMVYMIGSNLESKLGNASKDLFEMEEAQLDFTSANLLVYTGGSRRWTSDVPSDRNSVLDMAYEGEDRIAAQTQVSADMGAAATLQEFVRFCTDNYPSDHYALIFWDHGGGPLWGYGSDELFDSDSLSVEEMSAAMEETIFASSDRNLDFVGFDACLMGSVENMYSWSRYADYYVGSEELEPGDGWNYHFLSVLNQTYDTEEVTGEIIDSYRAYYEEQRSDTYNPDVTLSCANLSYIGEVADALGDVSARLTTRLDQGEYSAIQKSVSEVKSCGVVEDTKGGSSFYYDLVDLGSLAQEMSTQAEEESRRLLEAVDRLVVKQYSNVDEMTGVTMYYPRANKGQYSKLQDLYAEISISDSYTSYLSNVTQKWMLSSTRDWNVGGLSAAGDGGELISYTLTQEQQENVAAACYTILQDRRDGTYNAVLSNVEVKPDRNGNIQIPADPEILCLISDTGDRTIWPFHQVESGKSRSVYKTDSARLLNHLYFEYDMLAQVCEQQVSISLAQSEDSGELKIQSVNADDSDAVESSGKDTISTSGWEGINYYYHSVIPSRNADGRMAPFSKWTGDNEYYLVTSPIDVDFSFAFVPVSELKGGSFCLQLVLEDVSGEQYASELYNLSSDGRAHEVIEETAEGALVYAVYGDHAEVSGYTGNDTKLTISDRVEGLPVTVIQSGALSKVDIGAANGYYPFQTITLPETLEVIGNGAFRCCRDLETIILPSSVKSIGDNAFATCVSLTEFDLPDGLEKIGKGAFAYCTSLEQVTIPSALNSIGEAAFLGCLSLGEMKMSGKAEGGSSAGGYTVVDHMLLDPGKTKVLAYACGRTENVTIPEGVTNIGYGAFCRAGMEEVVFPDTLREIDNFAFYRTLNLSVPLLPKSLEKLGTYAFGANYIEDDEELAAGTLEEIQIGANLTSIGKGAFDEFLMRSFTVDPRNRSYSAVDGALCNKAGDFLICLAGGNQRIFAVPSGVVNLDMEVFDYVDIYNFGIDTIEVFIPESVTALLNTSSTNVFWLEGLIHCTPGSAAEEYARDHEIDFDFENVAKFEEHTEETAHGSCTYRVYEDHAALMDYAGTDKVLDLPALVQGKPLTIIGNGRDNVQKYDSYSTRTEFAEDESKSIEEVILPEGVKQVSGYAFDNCYLDSISLPDSVEVMGDQAVNLLMGGVMPQLPASLQYIGANFIMCSPVGELNLPASLTYIHPRAFDSLYSVTAYNLEEGNAYFSLREGCLYDAEGTRLLSYPSAMFAENEGEAVIPAGTEVIGESAFYNCSDLQSLVLPGGVLTIEEGAFYGCTSLESISFPESLRVIGKGAFSSCVALREVILPQGLEQIESYGFSSCKELAHVEFPDSLTTLGTRAFYECTNLKITGLPANLAVIEDEVFAASTDDEEDAATESGEVTLAIGPGLRSIGKNAFEALGVTSFAVDAENPYYSDAEGFLTNRAKDMIIVCPSGRTGEVQIPDSITRIGNYAFRNVPGLTDVNIPDSVTHISKVAFDYSYETVNTGSGEERVMKYNVTIHCSEGSYAHQYALTEGIPLVIE